MKIISIDIGTKLLGYSILFDGPKKIELWQSGTLEAKQKDSFKRLQYMYKSLKEIIVQNLTLQAMVLEKTVFVKGNQLKTVIALGKMAGIAIALAIENSLPVYEYEPKLIKKAATGQGNATKDAVRLLVCNQFNIKREIGFDESDAIATGLCHLHRR